jgi:hypothetical protein
VQIVSWSGCSSAQIIRTGTLSSQINIAQAERLLRDEPGPRPPSYYVRHVAEWRAGQLRFFAAGTSEWWGAFYQGALVAYLVIRRVEQTCLMQVFKTHAAHLQHYTADALLFTVLDHATKEPGCERIISGGPARPGLDSFKEKHLFKPVDFHYYTTHARLHAAAKRVGRCRELLRARLARFKAAQRGAEAST